VADEEVGAAAGSVGGFGGSVIGAGHDEEVEVLIGFYEGIDHLHGGGGVDILVDFADDEHEFAFEAVGLGRIR
jgi:hypothetical protein